MYSSIALRFLFVVALFLAFVAPSAAQQQATQSEITFSQGASDLPIRFENITLEDGLSQSTVYSIEQDRKGFMWFGTQIGLNRYDGHKIQQFMPDPFDSTSVHDDWIWSITEDSEGMLWLTYEDGTVGRFDPSTGKSRNYYASDTDSTTVAAFRSTHVGIDSKGYIWIAGNGIQRLNPDTGKVDRWGTNTGNGGAIGWTAGLVEEESGTYIVVGQEGVHRFNLETGSFTLLYDVPSGATLPNKDPKNPHIIWHGSLDDGIYRFDSSTGEFRNYNVTESDNDQSIEARPDPVTPGIVWVASEEGIVRLNAETGAYQAYRSGTGSASQSGELLNNSIGRIYADRAGILWASAGGFGVSRFDPTAMGFGKGEARPNDPNSMRGEVIWNVTPDKDGVVWVAAFGSESSEPGWYLNRVDRRTGKAQHWRTTLNERPPIVIDRNGDMLIGTRPNRDTPQSGGIQVYNKNSRTLEKRYTVANGFLPHDNIRRMIETSDGSIWAGTFAGLVRINPKTGQKKTWLRDSADPTKLRSDNVWEIFEDSKGNVWVVTFGDLVRFAPGSDTFDRIWDNKDAPADKDNILVRTLAEDQDGHIWLSAQLSGAPSRLIRYDPETNRMVTYTHKKSDRTSWSGGQTSGIHPHPSDSDLIYFLSYGAGMSRLRISTGEFTHYAAADGLLDPAVYTGIWDNEETLWVPTNSGLFRYNPATNTFRRFGMEYGLQSLEFNEGVVARSESNELFFGGVQGFNAFFPTQLRSNDVAPDVSITEFLLFNNRVIPGPGSPLSKSIINTESITLRHNQNAPTFQFAALHYKRPESNQIRYRLEPQEAEWIEANGRTEAAYTNLSPGEYTFRVIAANSDGVWNETGASVQLIILSPWWAKWWAYLIYAGVLGLAVFGVDRFQRRRLIKKEHEAIREHELAQAKEIETAYNQLRDTKQQLVEQEKLASLGSLTAGIAHEIKNPLNFVNNFAEVGAELSDELASALEKGDTKEALSILSEMKENSNQITKHGKRADSIVRAMMQHAKGGVSEREVVDINEFVEEYSNLAWHGMRARENGFQAEVKRNLGSDVGTTTVLPQELGRVLLNLFNNAYYAVMMPGAGKPPVVTVSTEKKDGMIVIRVADNGPGIPAEVKERIFEPFFTTKPTGEGTGLGLSLSHDIIVKGHNGTMTAGSSFSGGAEFVITLPA